MCYYILWQKKNSNGSCYRRNYLYIEGKLLVHVSWQRCAMGWTVLQIFWEKRGWVWDKSYLWFCDSVRGNLLDTWPPVNWGINTMYFPFTFNQTLWLQSKGPRIPLECIYNEYFSSLIQRIVTIHKTKQTNVMWSPIQWSVFMIA